MAEERAKKLQAQEEETKRVKGKLEYYTSEIDSFTRELSVLSEQLNESSAKSTRDELDSLYHKVTNSINPLEADFPSDEFEGIEDLTTELKKIPDSKLSISDHIRAKIGEACLLIKNTEE